MKTRKENLTTELAAVREDLKRLDQACAILRKMTHTSPHPIISVIEEMKENVNYTIQDISESIIQTP